MIGLSKIRNPFSHSKIFDANFRLFALLLKLFSVDKCIEQGALPISGLDGEWFIYLHSVGEIASAE